MLHISTKINVLNTNVLNSNAVAAAVPPCSKMVVIVLGRLHMLPNFHLWKDECAFKMAHLCKRNVKFFLEFGAFWTEKSQKKYFWLMWMKDNNSQNALASLP